MLTDLTSRNHELEMSRLTHEPFVQTSQRSELIRSTPVEPGNVQPDEAPARSPGIGVTLGLAILVFFLLKFFGGLRENERVTKYKATPPACPATPCPSCRFFSSNLYLKCAVRPADVLTERAVHCSDYCPRHSEQLD
jgi:hypothetical protein